MATVQLFNNTNTGTLLNFNSPTTSVSFVSTLLHDGVTTGYALSLATSAQYQWVARWTPTGAVNVTSIQGMDVFHIWVKWLTLSGDDYFTIGINGTSPIIRMRIAPGTPLNTWIKYEWSIEPQFKSAMGNSVTSLNFNLYGISSCYVDDVSFIQSDMGSLRPTDTAPILNVVNGLPAMPANSVFNADVSALPVHPKSSAWLAPYNNTFVHVDFGNSTTGGVLDTGIPYNIPSSVILGTYNKVAYIDESDSGQMPLFASYTLEYGTDKHLIVSRPIGGLGGGCALYEGWKVFPSTQPSQADLDEIGGGLTSPQPLPFAGQWSKFCWNSNGMRPTTWTSAEGSGLPIMPMLIKYEDVANGDLSHAWRFTILNVYGAIWPCTHKMKGNYYDPSGLYSDALTGSIPAGCAVRLKASVDISGMSTIAQRIARGMKKYPGFLADQGGNFFISGSPDSRWTSAILDLQVLKGSDFEVVDLRGVMVSPANYEVSSAPPAPTVTLIGLNNYTKTLAVGQTWQMQAIANLSNSTTLDVTSLGTWTTSNAGRFTVSTSGLVTCAGGTTGQTANIVITYGGQTQTCVFTVGASAPTYDRIELNTVSESIQAGSSYQLSVKGWSGATSTDITSGCTFSSSDSAKVSVTAGGLVYMIDQMATITATYGSLTAKANFWELTPGVFQSQPLFTDPLHPTTSILTNSILDWVVLEDANNHIIIGKWLNVNTNNEGIFTITSPLITSGQDYICDIKTNLGFRLTQAKAAE